MWQLGWKQQKNGAKCKTQERRLQNHNDCFCSKWLKKRGWGKKADPYAQSYIFFWGGGVWCAAHRAGCVVSLQLSVFSCLINCLAFSCSHRLSAWRTRLRTGLDHDIDSYHLHQAAKRQRRHQNQQQRWRVMILRLRIYIGHPSYFLKIYS